MASTVIHMAVASEINKKLKRQNGKLLIGTIAPDISKFIGENKVKSHFLENEDSDVPNINKFLEKYKKNLDDDFVMGYFIHLYTDYLWFKYFLPEIFNKETCLISKLDGNAIKCNGEMLSLYIYNDYTNLNIRLLEEYNMDLKIFYNSVPKMNNIIKEIPMDKLDVIINKAGLIIENSKVHKDLIFDIENVKQFISISKQLITEKIEEIMNSV